MDSKLQIISGKYRGRKLALPLGARPTQNRARIALFNILGSLDIHPKIVWDAFAGSGAFGVEFLSRYDDVNVIFTDVSGDSFKTINKNAAGMSGARAEMTDALNAIKRHGPAADLIFIDPPYSDPDLGPAFVRKLTPVVRNGAVLVWEMEKGNLGDKATQPLPTGWALLRDKTYGRARFLILERA